MFRDLDLTEEQRERLRTRREEKEETYQQAREQLKSLRAALGDELDKPEADQGKTDELVRQITSLQQQMLTERVDSILEMKEILTPEQFEKMAQKRKQMRENRGEFGRERMKRRPMDARAMQIGSGQIDPVTPEEEAGDS